MIQESQKTQSFDKQANFNNTSDFRLLLPQISPVLL